MDEKSQDIKENLDEVLPPEKSTKPELKSPLDLLPPAPQRLDESTVIIRTVPAKKGEPLGLENFRAWQQKAFWLLYMKKETGYTLDQIAKMVGKSKETVCRFGRSIEYRRIAGDTVNLDVERLMPLAIKRLEMILKFGTNEKIVAEQARWAIEKGLQERSFREKLKEYENDKPPVHNTLINIETLNDLSGTHLKTLTGLRANLRAKLEALLGSSEQAEGDRTSPAGHKAH